MQVDQDDYFNDMADEEMQNLDIEKVKFELDMESLKVYYQKYFPLKELCDWLSFEVDPPLFAHREFSFTLGNDAYLRFKSFDTPDLLKRDLVHLNPVKIDIGAVYNIKPREKKTVSSSAFVPMERELVFDIDMTDYDDIRTCCKEAQVCTQCWSFMTVAIQIINRVLTVDFGFEHVLWVFSGRRGVHCWVSDDRARKLSAEERRAIVGYIELIKGGKEMARKVNLRGYIHPSLQLALNPCSSHFRNVMLKSMGILDTKEEWTKLLKIIPDESLNRLTRYQEKVRPRMV